MDAENKTQTAKRDIFRQQGKIEESKPLFVIDPSIDSDRLVKCSNCGHFYERKDVYCSHCGFSEEIIRVSDRMLKGSFEP